MNNKGFVNILLIVLTVVAIGAVGYIAWNSMVPKHSTESTQTQSTSGNTPNQPSTQQANDSWKTYTDSASRFSVRYPSSLKPEVEKDPKFQIDGVWFRASFGTPFDIHIQVANSRWPNLSSFLNDQFLVSKGGNEPAPLIRTLPSGVQLRDIGKSQSGHKFVGQLNATQFIVITFQDEDLIDRVLSSFTPNNIEAGTEKNTNWKTFQNQKFSFKFRYPNSWFILETGNAIDLSDYNINDPRFERGNSDGTKIQFVSFTTTRKEFPQTITNENIAGNSDEFAKARENNSLIEYKATKPNDGNCSYIIFDKKSNQQVCIFAWFQRANIDTILSTFDFVR